MPSRESTFSQSESLPPNIRAYLEEYLAYGSHFVDPPQVRLALATQGIDADLSAADVATTVAYQCYQPGVTPMRHREPEKSQRVLDITLDGGHHTTRQHMYYCWHLVGISRSALHDVFHAHPYYNSEQQSQRYAEARAGYFLLPAHIHPEQREHYERSADFMNQAYFQLLEALQPYVLERIGQMYPSSRWLVDRTQKRLEEKAKKICQEIARYVLPIAQKTNLYHTLSELQLLRLFRASQIGHFTEEVRYIIARMVGEVGQHDPSIYRELRTPVKIDQHPQIPHDEKRVYCANFDAALDSTQSKQSAITGNPRDVLTSAIQNALCVPAHSITYERALQMLFDPHENGLWADVFDSGMHDPVTQAARNVSVTFLTRLSHTADSQRQRHRMTPGTTPPISASYTGIPDYVTPLIIRETPELAQLYDSMMESIYAHVEAALKVGVPLEYAHALLPNAHTLRVVESGDVFDWVHRLRLRLCYLAQEEIFFISLEQAKAFVEEFPEGRDLFLAPCGVRKAAAITPKCPEGDRWCGKPVYNWDLDTYAEGRLI